MGFFRLLFAAGYIALIWWMASSGRIVETIILIGATAIWGLVAMEARLDRVDKALDRLNGLDPDA